MCAIARKWTDFKVSLMQSLQIFTFFTTTDYNHRIIMTSQNIIYHQSGNTTITVLKRMNTYITIMK